MIKVLHVVHSMECGGIENILMNIYRKIDKDKIQFDFLVNGSKDNYYTKEILELGGNVCNVTPKRKNFIKNMIETKRIMKQGNYDIVHIHQDSMIAFGIWCSKKANVKVIFTHAHTTSAIGWYRKLITKLARKYISKNSTITSKELNENTISLSENLEEYSTEKSIQYDGTNQTFCGILTSKKVLTTKNNKQMMFANVEDLYGSIETICNIGIFIIINAALCKDIGYLLPYSAFTGTDGTDSFQQFTEIVFAESCLSLFHAFIIHCKPFYHIFL